ncbi:hypothetical protein NDU88_005604, partial [Pleurodeles waltl]
LTAALLFMDWTADKGGARKGAHITTPNPCYRGPVPDELFICLPAFPLHPITWWGTILLFIILSFVICP